VSPGASDNGAPSDDDHKDGDHNNACDDASKQHHYTHNHHTIWLFAAITPSAPGAAPV
jgi:hypothetical protein